MTEKPSIAQRLRQSPPFTIETAGDGSSAVFDHTVDGKKRMIASGFRSRGDAERWIKYESPKANG